MDAFSCLLTDELRGGGAASVHMDARGQSRNQQLLLMEIDVPAVLV